MAPMQLSSLISIPLFFSAAIYLARINYSCQNFEQRYLQHSTISPQPHSAIYIKDNVDESLFGSLESARAKTRSINKAIAHKVARYHSLAAFQSGSNF
jgi:hypothetical protein